MGKKENKQSKKHGFSKEAIVKKGFLVKGTTCASCDYLVKEAVESVDGVRSVDFSYETETGHVVFDSNKTNIDEILSAIEKNDQFECFILDNSVKDKKSGAGSFFSNSYPWIFIALGVLVIGYFLFNISEGVEFPKISQDMGYVLLFVVGLLTGFHCITMCGGFVLGYSASAKEKGDSIYKAHALYGAGKTISYTVIGAAFGLLGSIIAFTPGLRGTVGILAGIFMIIFGMNMLNLFPGLRKIRIPLPKGIQAKINKSTKGKGPFIIGLLNGLMIACGPLQAIYIMAAGTGSMAQGAMTLFVFGLGTLPALLGFGLFASYISSHLKRKIVKFSGIAVAILGILMLNNGLALLGTGYDFDSVTARLGGNVLAIPEERVAIKNPIELNNGYQEIRMVVDRNGYTPDKFVLEKGVHVKWIIEGKELTGCNNAIQVPSLGLKFDINEGEQIIEFTPEKEGIISWSCWMGMIPGVFIVKEGTTSG